ncbi:N-6 DNA methylase [Rhodobacter lacus]|uniref:N-6 DNA methylase n=1 Tax=Rhodobacter lacus TaxID=1641972 RepID=A0ABW5ABS9_9RHOB
MTAIEVKRDGKGRIFSHVRKKWLIETPEEAVRQEYLLHLVNEYQFSLDQISEEMDLTGRGSASARADFVLWRTVQDKIEDNAPFVIVECKSDNVTIKPADYNQGENYARIVGAPFFVTHNSRETKYWRVKKEKVPGYTEEIENIPHGNASDKDIEELLNKLRAFKEKEFADLLHQCHNIIRNREKKDPAAAFDEIAKVLFTKVYVERQLLTRRSKTNLFTVDVLKGQIAENPLDNLFQQTKSHYSTDKIFDDDERINLKPATGEEIVRKLEKYNLSDTSEDVKGVAFERFLGRTFRGEIGQFFTPRTIVEFMVHMVDPQEGEVVCDPASGSGGFLIRVFEIVREKILADADRQYNEFKVSVDADTSLSEEEKAKKLKARFEEIQRDLDQSVPGSRLWKLSNRCIYGTDANDRMARTSKMNMIMHGDGHGGVHHHDGFLNVNGIFEGRFDIILTNPPFGANVEPSDKILPSEIEVSPAAERRYLDEYGELYRESQARVKAHVNKPIASLFKLPASEKSKIKTELLFIERCLDLLKPGGRMGIVLPEGIFNNPSLTRVREFTEDRAFLRAVVSLPPETFVSSGASVKCSLLFLQKFTEVEERVFRIRRAACRKFIEKRYEPEIAAERSRLDTAILAAKDSGNQEARTALQKELREYISRMEGLKTAESRKLAKIRFPYSIFMYEADHVGISATGEEDTNELGPNTNLPEGITRSCIEWFELFRNDPNALAGASS